MKGRRNNRLSGNRNSPFVGRLQHTRKLDKHIDHHLYSIAKFKHISSGRELAYYAPNELLLPDALPKVKTGVGSSNKKY